jgi:hypothetical protein
MSYVILVQKGISFLQNILLTRYFETCDSNAINPADDTGLISTAFIENP